MKQISSIIKQYIFILGIIVSMLTLQGCGSGNTVAPDTNTTPETNINPDKNDTPNTEPITGETADYKYNRITIAGSSITWGQGYLGEEAYLGEVEKYFRDEVATTIIPTNGEVINDAMSYKGKLYKYTGAGTEIKGSIKGDKISIAFAKERGNAGATVEMIIDGVSKGTFSTKGEDIQRGSVSINGNGSTLLFDLGRAHTFNHNVQGYGAGFINTARCGDSVTNNGWLIIRKEVGKKIHHFIVFKNAPSDNFTITFDYAETIKPVKSTVDHISQSIESPLESPCGEKYNDRIPPIPDQSLDFRQTDERAVMTWGGLGYKDHNFTLKIKDGGSEEFILNFITNHMYYFQNAGISGAKAEDFDPTTPYNGRNPNPRTTEQIIAFKPDLFILESSTNDALTWAREKQNEIGTNTWIVKDAVSFSIASSNQIQLASPTNVKAGDVVVMGTYNNDIRNIAVGIVSQDSNLNIITLTKDIPTDVVKICVIKRITKWENNVKTVINQVTDGIDHTVKIGIATSGVPNLYDDDGVERTTERKLMGYREKGKIMAAKNGWMFFDFFAKTLDVSPSVDTEQLWSIGDNTHPNANGNILFGAAITDVLKDQ